jgi:hypothetical protein
MDNKYTSISAQGISSNQPQKNKKLQKVRNLNNQKYIPHQPQLTNI